MDRIPDSYRAAREGAGLADRRADGRLLMRGRDRLSWLQGLVTNDVGALVAGQGCYTLMLTPQGRIIADMRVLETGAFALADVPPGLAGSLAVRLEGLVIMEDVGVDDLTDQLSRFSVHGPDAVAVVSTALEVDAAGLRRFEALVEHQNQQVGGDVLSGGVLVAGSRELGVRGLDVYIRREEARRIEEALVRAGAVPIDDATRRLLRIEAGEPAFGVDVDDQTIPLEAGLESRAISFTKGCYVGQEVIVRVRDRGHGRVARRLVGVVADGPFASGDALAADGREAGRVTSAAWSPALGRHIGLGYVHRDLLEPGTRLVADPEGRAVPAVVTALPFVRD